jgi:O-antigen/teichoic acid export membrane protein
MLMSLATSATASGPLPVIADPSRLAPRRRQPASPAALDGHGAERPGTILARLRDDHLVRNSLFLILSSAVQAGLGFAFWIIAARLFSIADVGRASSLISATTMVAFFALLGLNSTFVRFLPSVPDKDSLITAGLMLVALCGAVLGLGYALLTPVLAPRLAFVAHRPVLAIGFALLTGAAAVNLLTDSIFIASRKAGYNTLVDGGFGGLSKVAASLALTGTGAYGLFCASASGSAVAAVASLLLMMKVLRWRPALKSLRTTLWPLLRFSGANYVGNVLNMLPSLVVPLIVLDRLGASAAAYYFVPFQVAQLLYSAGGAVEQAFLAEGAHEGTIGRELLRRSARVLIAFCLPAYLVLTVAARWLLLVFGVSYSQHGSVGLMLLAAAALPIAAGNWLMTVLRLAGRLRAIVVSNVVYAVGISALAWFLAPHGLTAVCAAWPVGALLGTAVAAIAAVSAMPRAARARHRRAAHAGRA